MIKNIAVSILVMLLASLVSCTGIFGTPVTVNNQNTTSQVGPISSATFQNSLTKPVQTTTPTQMSETGASTLLPTLMVTLESANGITKKCLNVLPFVPRGYEYQGKLILNNVDKNLDYLYDFQTAQTNKFPNHGLLNIAGSPNGKEYAYHDDRGSPYLQIYSSDGHLKHSISWEKDWFWMDGWLDDNHIMFEIPEVTPTGLGHLNIEYPEPLMLLDITTNQKQKLLPDYPGIDAVNNQISWWSGTTVYDTSLSRVVYPGWIVNGVEAGYNLWDIPDKRKIVGLSAGNYHQGPEWWPDGSKFIVNVDNAFYIVTRDGAISKLVDLVALDTSSQAFKLSPDGRNVALWIGSSTVNYYTLAVLDTQTEKMTDYCIHPEYGLAMNNYPPEPPIWSPDGKAIAIDASDSAGQPEGDTILVDLEKGIAVKVASGLAPIGWLAAP